MLNLKCVLLFCIFSSKHPTTVIGTSTCFIGSLHSLPPGMVYDHNYYASRSDKKFKLSHACEAIPEQRKKLAINARRAFIRADYAKRVRISSFF